MKGTWTCVIAVAAVLCREGSGDTWVVSRSVARVRNGPKPFCRTVTHVKKRTRIEVVGKDIRGRWLEASGIVLAAADGTGKEVVPFKAAADAEGIQRAWVPRLAARPLQAERSTASQAALFTMDDVQAMQISVGAAIRGLNKKAAQMVQDQKLDPTLAAWIAAEKFTLEEYEAFRTARDPEKTGKPVAVSDEDQLLELDPEVMERIGHVAATQMAQELGGRVVKDKALNAYVNMVAALVGEFSSRYDLVYRVSIVRDPAVNSYSRPGGYIAITTGLLRLCDDEAQLAAALAHEIAHISRDHGLRERKNVAREIGIDIFGLESELEQAVKDAFGNDSKAFHTIEANQLNRMLNVFRAPAFSKKRHTQQEREADVYAMVYLARAGYDPSALSRLVQILGQADPGHLDMTMTCHDPPSVRLSHIAEGMRKLGRSGQFPQLDDASVKQQRNPIIDKTLGPPEPPPPKAPRPTKKQAQRTRRDPFAELEQAVQRQGAWVD